MLTNNLQYDILNPLVRSADFLCQNAPLVCVDEQTALLTNRRNGGFLLEDRMKKICSKCDIEKPTSAFYMHKTGKNAGYRFSYCKSCIMAYLKTQPWRRAYNHILWRTNHHTRGYKNIKNKISLQNLKELWFRDKAYLMKQPSIDRRNSKGDYTFENCRFIEFIENCREGGLHRKGWRKTNG